MKIVHQKKYRYDGVRRLNGSYLHCFVSVMDNCDFEVFYIHQAKFILDDEYHTPIHCLPVRERADGRLYAKYSYIGLDMSISVTVRKVPYTEDQDLIENELPFYGCRRALAK